jgi:hypothetical protein
VEIWLKFNASSLRFLSSNLNPYFPIRLKIGV